MTITEMTAEEFEACVRIERMTEREVKAALTQLLWSEAAQLGVTEQVRALVEATQCQSRNSQRDQSFT